MDWIETFYPIIFFKTFACYLLCMLFVWWMDVSGGKNVLSHYLPHYTSLQREADWSDVAVIWENIAPAVQVAFSGWT